MLNIAKMDNWLFTERKKLRDARASLTRLGRDSDQRMVPAFYLDIAKQEGIVLALGALLIEFKKDLKQDLDAADDIVLDALLSRASETLLHVDAITPLMTSKLSLAAVEAIHCQPEV
jgi:hypothetical protein